MNVMMKTKTGRPKKAPGEARDNRIVVWVNARERARYLVNAARAGSTAADFARSTLCHEGVKPSSDNDNQPDRNDFELIDALTRIGTTLMQLAPIIEETHCSPHEFDDVLKKLDQALDRLLPS